MIDAAGNSDAVFPTSSIIFFPASVNADFPFRKRTLSLTWMRMVGPIVSTAIWGEMPENVCVSSANRTSRRLASLRRSSFIRSTRPSRMSRSLRRDSTSGVSRTCFSSSEMAVSRAAASWRNLSRSASHACTLALSSWVLFPVAFSFSSSSEISSSRVIRVPSYFPTIEARSSFPVRSSSSPFCNRLERTAFSSFASEICFSDARSLASMVPFSLLANATASRSVSASLVFASYVEAVTRHPPVPNASARTGTTLRNPLVRNP